MAPARRGAVVWPWQMAPRQRYIYLAIFVAVVLAFIGYAALSGDNDDDPGGTTELCDMLADPRNSNSRLTVGDIRRLSDLRQDELERYVAARCPEHLARISD